MINSLGEVDAARGNIAKIAEIWNSSPERKTIGTAVNLQGEIEFKDFGLSLGGKKVLENINFTVGTNSMVAVVGPAASGKTTLLKVIQGFIKLNKPLNNFQ